jgi:hypothetical protein
MAPRKPSLLPPLPGDPGSGQGSATTTSTTAPPLPLPKSLMPVPTVPSNPVPPNKTRLGTVPMEKKKGGWNLIPTYAKSSLDMVINAGPGMVHFVGGGAVDLVQAFGDIGASVIGVDYQPGYQTTNQLIQSVKGTGQLAVDIMKRGAAVGRVTPVSTPGGVSMGTRTIEPFSPRGAGRYEQAIANNQSILPYIIEDAGNVTLFGSIFKGAGRGVSYGGRRVAGKPTAPGAGGAAATRGLPGLGGVSQEAAAAGGFRTAAGSRLQKVGASLINVGDDLNRATATLGINKVANVPFLPYALGRKGILNLYRNGIYVGGDSAYIAWGTKAAIRFQKRINQLRDEGVPVDDPVIVDLEAKKRRAGNRAMTQQLKKETKEAVRDRGAERGAVFRGLLNEIDNPLYKDDINPDTGEAYGRLTPAEGQAVIAVLNGTAQMIFRLKKIFGDKLTPEMIALLGRYDLYPEFALTPEGADIAYSMLNPNESVISQQTFDRVSYAMDNLGRSIVNNMTARAIKGYGRRNPLPPEYLVPQPFVEKLGRNVEEALRKAEADLVNAQRGGKATPEQIAALMDNVIAMENLLSAWNSIVELGITELPLDHPDRINALKSVVDMLPDELALDPSMYSAAQRIPLEFFRRFRAAMGRHIIEGTTFEDGGPTPGGPEDGSPRTPRNAKFDAVDVELAKRERTVEKIEKDIVNLGEKIHKKEEQHVNVVEKLVRYEIIDEYIAGKPIQQIADERNVKREVISKIISSSPAANTFNRMEKIAKSIREMEAAYDGVIDETELDYIKNQVNVLKAEIAELQAEYDSLKAAEMTSRAIVTEEEYALSQELDDLDTRLDEHEAEYELAGGVVDDLWVDDAPDTADSEAIDFTEARTSEEITKSIYDEVYDSLPATAKFDKDQINKFVETVVSEKTVQGPGAKKTPIKITTSVSVYYDKNEKTRVHTKPSKDDRSPHLVIRADFDSPNISNAATRDKKISIMLGEEGVYESVKSSLEAIEEARLILQGDPYFYDELRTEFYDGYVSFPYDAGKIKIDDVELFLTALDAIENEIRSLAGLPKIGKSVSPRRGGPMIVPDIRKSVILTINRITGTKVGTAEISIGDENSSRERAGVVARAGKKPGKDYIVVDFNTVFGILTKDEFIQAVEIAKRDVAEAYEKVKNGEREWAAGPFYLPGSSTLGNFFVDKSSKKFDTLNIQDVLDGMDILRDEVLKEYDSQVEQSTKQRPSLSKPAPEPAPVETPAPTPQAPTPRLVAPDIGTPQEVATAENTILTAAFNALDELRAAEKEIEDLLASGDVQAASRRNIEILQNLNWPFSYALIDSYKNFVNVDKVKEFEGFARDVFDIQPYPKTGYVSKEQQKIDKEQAQKARNDYAKKALKRKNKTGVTRVAVVTHKGKRYFVDGYVIIPMADLDPSFSQMMPDDGFYSHTGSMTKTPTKESLQFDNADFDGYVELVAKILDDSVSKVVDQLELVSSEMIATGKNSKGINQYEKFLVFADLQGNFYRVKQSLYELGGKNKSPKTKGINQPISNNVIIVPQRNNNGRPMTHLERAEVLRDYLEGLAKTSVPGLDANKVIDDLTIPFITEEGSAQRSEYTIVDQENALEEFETTNEIFARSDQNLANIRVQEEIIRNNGGNPYKRPESSTPAPAPSPSLSPVPVDGTPSPYKNLRADYVIIPCGAAKGPVAAPVEELYTGSMFQDALTTARQMFTDDRIFVLSAKHGLMPLGTVIEPYEQQIGKPGAVEWNDVSVQLQQLGIEFANVLSLLPKNYHALLKRSTEGIGGLGVTRHRLKIEQAFEGTKGIGEQKAVLAQLRKNQTLLESAPVPEAPASLRPKAQTPAEVQPDTKIRDEAVQRAVYYAELADAAAAKVSAALNAAETLTERLQYLEEYFEKKGEYDVEVNRLAIQLEVSQRARARRDKLEQEIADLRLKQVQAEEGLEPAKESIEGILTHPYYEGYQNLTGDIPLDVAMGGNFPTDIGGYSLPDLEGNTVPLSGPMYVPSGGPKKFFGGVAQDVTEEGLTGWRDLKSEHYRDGDRHVIFSLEQVAIRMGQEVSMMVENERYRFIIATFGETASAILGDEFTQQLYEQAVQWADNYDASTLQSMFKEEWERAQQDPDFVPGIASYAPGIPSPAQAREFAIRTQYGTLIAEAMEKIGYTPIDPYKNINALYPERDVNANRLAPVDEGIDPADLEPVKENIVPETMFLPTGMREVMMQVVVPRKNATLTKLLKASAAVTSSMKTTTLVFSIPWQLGDIISGIQIAKAAGIPFSVFVEQLNTVLQQEFGSIATRKDAVQTLKRFAIPEIDPNANIPQRLKDFLTPEPMTVGPLGRVASESPVQDLGQTAQERSVLYPGTMEPKKRLTNRIADKLGIKQIGYIGNVNKATVGTSYKINGSINKLMRHAFFLSKLDQSLRARGMTLEQLNNDAAANWKNDPEIRQLVFDAAESANDWLGDYANLNMKERMYYSQAFPFYSWMRHIHHVFNLVIDTNPEFLGYYLYVGSLYMNNAEEDPMNLRRGSISAFGGVSNAGFINPFADVAGGPLFSFAVEGNRNPLGQSLGPVPRLLGGAAGFDVTKFRTLSRPAGTGSYDEAGNLTYSGVLRNPGEALGFTLQQFPLATRIMNINPTPFDNIPGTRIALGPVSRYQTGEARTNPVTGQRLESPGGRLAATARLFGTPLVPYRTDDQINQVMLAARGRLMTLEELLRRREISGAP